MLKSVKKMFDAFEEHQIIYCHWKSNEHIEAALYGDTDLDVLFSPCQRGELENVLCKCGLKRFRAMPLMQYNAIEDFIGFDVDACKIWHLHLHYRMTLGEPHLKGYTITPFTDYILNNRIKTDAGVYTSSPEVEYILLLIRMCLKLRLRDWFRKVGKDDVKELNWLKERSEEEAFERHVKALFRDNNSVQKIKALYGVPITAKKQLRPLRKELLRVLKPFTGYGLFVSRCQRLRREFFWLIGGIGRRLSLNPTRAYRRVSPSGGCVVAFLGCDGAGKSTTIEYLHREYKKKIDVKTIYMGSGDGSSSLLRLPMKFVACKLGGRGLGQAVENEYHSKKYVSLKARVYSLAKIVWAITLIQEKKEKLRQMTKARNNGMLVLVDRYPQVSTHGYSDGPLLTKYLHSRNTLCKWLAKKEYSVYERAAYNAPDLIVKLSVPTEVALRRKPEMTIDEIEKKKRAVMAVDISPSIMVETNCDFQQSIRIVMCEIWKII
jgi:thymidylate kinase